jgi:hypothetical protein
VQRTCTSCGETKPPSEFRRSERDGSYSLVCMDCWKPSRQQRYVYQSMRHYLAQKLRYCHKPSNRRVKRGIEVNITIDDVMEMYDRQGGKCAVTGIEMTHSIGGFMTNASIDRLDPDGHYELGNIRLVCTGVNIMRMRLTDEDLGHWCEAIAKGMGLWKKR